MSTPETALLTPAEYLEIERKSEIKHEYINGRMYAMPGVSRRHSLIAGNIFAAIQFEFRDRPCEVHMADLRLKVDPTGLYTYTDIAAVCGEARFEDIHTDTLLNPSVVVEVLSDSTESYDRGKKFEHYRRLESLQEYVLVAQNEMHIEHFVRNGDQWLLSELSDPKDRLRLPSIACEIILIDIYAKVQFPPIEDSRSPRRPRPASR
jgi:Uma2 family endonuclease